MRKALITVVLVGMARCLQATPLIETGDTIRTFENVNKISVVDLGKVARISVYSATDQADESYDIDIASAADDERWNLRLPFLKHNKKSRREWPASSYYGFRQLFYGRVLPVGASDAFRSSWEIGIAEIGGVSLQTSRLGPELSVGFGMGYRRINVGKGSMICSDTYGSIALCPASENYEKVKSGIRSFNIMFPFTVRQKLSRCHNFGLLIGAVANLNTYTKAFSSYNIDGVKCNETFKGLHQRMLTMELMAGLGWMNNVGIYVRYAPCHMFGSGYGPGFRTMSVGLSLGF